MPIAKVFKNRIPNCKVIHPDGRIVTFFNHKHITVIKKDIDYLQSLVDENDPNVYVDPDEAEIDTDELTEEGRIAKIKRQGVEEFLRLQAQAAQHNSNSTGQPLGMMNSSNVVNAVESNGAASSAAKVVGSSEAAVATQAAPVGGFKVSAPTK